MEYPIIPDIELPCIPIWPPFIMLCPEIDVYTDFGLGLEPDIQSKEIGMILTPSVGFDISASLGLAIGIEIINAQIVMGIDVSVIVLSFPFEIGVNLDDFGLFGDIKVDLKVLELTIFLKFKVCLDLFLFLFGRGPIWW